MKKLTFLLLTLATTLTLNAQVAINKTGSTPTPASILHVKGDATDKNIILEPGTGGGVSIGTTDAPTHKLTIQSEADNKALRLIGTIAPYGVGAQLNFGDGDFTYIKESGDDSLTIYANQRTSIMGGNVGVSTTTPDPSASLDVSSTTKGFLPPRMTTAQMHSITSPAEGLMVYNTTIKTIYFYDGSTWQKTYNNDGTPSDPITNYGGRTYQTVIIGDQIWMAENLNIGGMISGSSDQTDNTLIERYCYDNDINNCNIYGGLYQWAEMVQYLNGATNIISWYPEPTGNVQGICPPGWHIPTDAEWKTLEMHLGMTPAEADAIYWRGTHNEGGKLKETGTTHWNSPNTGATNSSGFTALPGGHRNSSGSFSSLGHNGDWWSSSEGSGTHAWYRNLYYSGDQVYRLDNDNKTNGFSVRCIKD
jgi:uncharacterized protein (TIGR02145 family)